MSFFNARAFSPPALRCCVPLFLVLIACEAHKLRARESREETGPVRGIFHPRDLAKRAFPIGSGLLGPKTIRGNRLILAALLGS